MDLTTRYLGLNLRTPLVPSASPLSDDLDNIKQLEDAGASAVVLHSIFEEQVRSEAEAVQHHMSYGTDSFAESLTFFPKPAEFMAGPEEYLGQDPQSQRCGAHSNHCQPEWHCNRRLG